MTAGASLADGVTDAVPLRRAFGSFATGVTVLAVGGPQPHGMTANAFASVSLSPPLLLVCVSRGSVMQSRLFVGQCFALSVLARDQTSVARRFADPCRPLGVEQFRDVAWRPGPRTSAPIICGSLAGFECRVRTVHDGGDHVIILAALLDVHPGSDDEALLFFRSRFAATGEPAPSCPRAARTDAW